MQTTSGQFKKMRWRHFGPFFQIHTIFYYLKKTFGYIYFYLIRCPTSYTDKHSTQHCTTGWLGQLCILPFYRCRQHINLWKLATHKLMEISIDRSAQHWYPSEQTQFILIPTRLLNVLFWWCHDNNTNFSKIILYFFKALSICNIINSELCRRFTSQNF